MTKPPDEAIRERLEAAGWSLTARAKAMDKAELEYEGPGMELKARHEPEKDALYLTLEEAGAGKLTLKVEFGDALDDLLGLIVARQDELDGDNYNAFVNDVVKTCPSTFGIRDGELIELEAE